MVRWVVEMYIEVASDYEYVTRMERGLKCGVYTV